MSMSRRIALMQIFVAGCVGELLRTQAASAETVDYQYDALGRLQSVTRGSDSAKYTLDNAGNRVCSGPTCLPPPAPPPLTFNATIQIPSGGPVDLRLLANAAGYNGATNAAIVFEVASGVTVTGAAGVGGMQRDSFSQIVAAGAGGMAIDTGNWPTIYATSLQLVVKTGGIVRGGGAAGGEGGSPYGGYGQPGGAGGDAVFCRTPITIQVESGGFIQSGSGGGGGGGGATTNKRGAGGGGAAPNGPAGLAGTGGGTGTAGQPGTTSGGGAGGTGNAGLGGAGGSYGVSGGAGVGSYSAAGGVAGYAIRKNGKTVSVTNNGTITGTVG